MEVPAAAEWEQAQRVCRLISVAAIALSAYGCDNASQGSMYSVRDSSGVAIVEHEGNLWATEPRWRLSTEPTFRIGTIDGDAPYLFDGITGVLGLSDGRVVVANSGDATLRWYHPSGELDFQRGGEGEGPGEFDRLSGITLVSGDSVIALDWSNRRFTPFGPEGGLGATIPIEGITAPPGNAHRLDDGTWIVGTSGFSTAQLDGPPAAGVHRFESPILRLSADGSTADTLGMFLSNEVEVILRDRGFLIGPARFGRRVVYGVTDNLVAVGTGDRLELEFYSPEGQLVRVSRAPDVDLTLTAQIAEQYRAHLRAQLTEVAPEERGESERRIAEIKLPPALPAYSTLIVDDASNLWVGEYRYDSEAPRSYLIFNSDGVFVTRVEVPAGFRVLTVNGDRVWGRETDELDVQYVASYDMIRGLQD